MGRSVKGRGRTRTFKVDANHDIDDIWNAMVAFMDKVTANGGRILNHGEVDDQPGKFVVLYTYDEAPK